MKYTFLTILSLTLAIAVFGQDEEKLNGKVKTVTWERTHLTRNERPADKQKETIFIDQYDADGQISQISTFGNGEERTIFDRSAGKLKITILYFDPQGNPIAPGAEKFIGKTTDPTYDGLCRDFTKRQQENQKEKTILVYEICSDGTSRASTKFGYSTENQLIRSFREDAKGRSWEYFYTYSPNGEVSETVSTINDGKQPKFSQQSKLFVLEYDTMRNWIRRIVSDFDSRRPGQLVHQFVDERKIIYYEN